MARSVGTSAASMQRPHTHTESVPASEHEAAPPLQNARLANGGLPDVWNVMKSAAVKSVSALKPASFASVQLRSNGSPPACEQSPAEPFASSVASDIVRSPV